MFVLRPYRDSLFMTRDLGVFSVSSEEPSYLVAPYVRQGILGQLLCGSKTSLQSINRCQLGGGGGSFFIIINCVWTTNISINRSQTIKKYCWLFPSEDDTASVPFRLNLKYLINLCVFIANVKIYEIDGATRILQPQ